MEYNAIVTATFIGILQFISKVAQLFGMLGNKKQYIFIPRKLLILNSKTTEF